MVYLSSLLQGAFLSLHKPQHLTLKRFYATTNFGRWEQCLSRAVTCFTTLSLLARLVVSTFPLCPMSVYLHPCLFLFFKPYQSISQSPPRRQYSIFWYPQAQVSEKGDPQWAGPTNIKVEHYLPSLPPQKHCLLSRITYNGIHVFLSWANKEKQS